MHMMSEDLIQQLKQHKVPHEMIAQAIGRARPAATKLLSGARALKANEVEPLRQLLNRWRHQDSFGMPGAEARDIALVMADSITYLPVDILPTFAGMGGGGTGEGDVEKALIPRYLIEDVFRGRPADFVVVRTRGDSMVPDFYQDDELLIDKRDRSPVQPGPFALYDADDEAYVVKNVEKLGPGRYRVFSTNTKYPSREVDREETRIIGRPVWVGRRL